MPTPPRPALPSSREQGFTLVEMLVVTVVIAILAGIAIPLFLGQRAKARDAAVKADLRTLVLTVLGELHSAAGEPVDLGPVSDGVVLEGSTGGGDLTWRFADALAAYDEEGPSGRDDVHLANYCIGVGHVDGAGSDWRYTPRGGYAEGRCFGDED